MKKIDMYGNTFTNIREAIGFVAGIGAELSIDCLLLPFVKTIIKNRAIRLVAYSGTYALSYTGMIIGNACAKDIVDTYANAYNLIADKVNDSIEEKNEEPEKVEEIDKHNESNQAKENETGVLDGVVVDIKKYVSYMQENFQCFTFSTEEQAKQVFLQTRDRIDKEGFISFTHYYYLSYAPLRRERPDQALLDAGDTIGWNKDIKGLVCQDVNNNFVLVMNLPDYLKYNSFKNDNLDDVEDKKEN